MFRIDVDGDAGRRHRLVADRSRRRPRVRSGMERPARVAGQRRRDGRPSPAHPTASPPTADATCWSRTRASTTPPRTPCAVARGSSTAARGPMPWRGGELTLQQLGARHVAARSVGRVSPTSTSGSTGVALDESRWWPYYTPHWSSRAASGRPLRDRRSTGSSCASTPTPQPWAPELDGELRVVAPADRPVLRTGRQRDRAAPVPRRADRARGAARAAGCGCRTSASSRCGCAAIRHPDAMVAFWPIGFEDAARRLRRDLHRRDLRQRARRRRRLGGRRRQAAERSAAARGLREGPGRGRPDGVPRLRRRVDADRMRFFIDGRWVKTVAAVDRLPGAVHARRVRPAERVGHAGCRGTAVPVRGRARPHLPAAVRRAVARTR